MPIAEDRAPPADETEARLTFLAAWRRGSPDTAASPEADARWRPAEPAMPVVPLRDAADLAVRREMAASAGGPEALLSIVLGPVQPFIAAGRSLRDLWTGSAMLSWIAFRAIVPILERLGPTAMVFPALRGNPLMDQWLRQKGVPDVPAPAAGAGRTPALPHRLLAVVPWGADGAEARAMAEACETAARQAFRDVAEAVHQELAPKLGPLDPHWDARWDEQIAAMLSVTTSVAPTGGDEATLARLLDRPVPDPERARLREALTADEQVPEVLRAAVDRDWPAELDLSGRATEAARSVRPVPRTRAEVDAPHPPKCTLLGTWEQMGPARREEARAFWDTAQKLTIKGVRLRSNERFCAQSLVKRFAMPAGLGEWLGLPKADMRFPDTATVAAHDWMADNHLDWRELDGIEGRPWNGQWLHGHDGELQPDEAPPEAVAERIKAAREGASEAPPTYYAVLQCDGDDMGGWLRGHQAPRLSEVLHDGTLARRLQGHERMPVGPHWHALFSQALASFATAIVPRIVAHHGGTLIYAGGDDLLAVMPVRRVLACARDLRAAFRGEPGGLNASPHAGWFRFEGDTEDHLTLGRKAGLSAGICLAHVKEDLRLVLDKARAAEKAAKDAGRDGLAISALRRSGEHGTAVAGWDDVAWLEALVHAFREGVSDRWAYRLRALEPTLGTLPPEIAVAEIVRQVNRQEPDSRETLHDAIPPAEGAAGDTAADRIAGHFLAFRARREAKGARTDSLLKDFLLLCQTASFMARGRER